VTAASGGVEASLKAAANEVFGFLSTAHEELTNATSRSKVSSSTSHWTHQGGSNMLAERCVLCYVGCRMLHTC
jgi:hypothetical protein